VHYSFGVGATTGPASKARDMREQRVPPCATREAGATRGAAVACVSVEAQTARIQKHHGKGMPPHRGPSVYKTDALPLSHTGVTFTQSNTIFHPLKPTQTPQANKAPTKLTANKQNNANMPQKRATIVIDHAYKWQQALNGLIVYRHILKSQST